jgi:hypothetical protein
MTTFSETIFRFGECDTIRQLYAVAHKAADAARPMHINV